MINSFVGSHPNFSWISNDVLSFRRLPREREIFLIEEILRKLPKEKKTDSFWDLDDTLWLRIFQKTRDAVLGKLEWDDAIPYIIKKYWSFEAFALAHYFPFDKPQESHYYKSLNERERCVMDISLDLMKKVANNANAIVLTAWNTDLQKTKLDIIGMPNPSIIVPWAEFKALAMILWFISVGYIPRWSRFYDDRASKISSYRSLVAQLTWSNIDFLQVDFNGSELDFRVLH